MTTALPTNRLAPGPSMTAECLPSGGPLGTNTAAVGAGLTSVLGWFDVAAWGGLRAQLSVAAFGGTLVAEYSMDGVAVHFTGPALPAVVAGVPYDSGAIAPLAQYARLTYTQNGGGASGVFRFVLLTEDWGGGGGGGGGGVPANVDIQGRTGTKPSPDPSDIPGAVSDLYLQSDPDHALRTRARVLTDEDTFEDDFLGADLITAIVGNVTLTNASTAWSRVAATTLLRVGDYIELDADRADAAPVWAQIATINPGGLSGTLVAAYTGAGGTGAGSKSNYTFQVPAAGGYAVGISILQMDGGNGNGDTAWIRRGLGGGGRKATLPVGVEFVGRIDVRRANQKGLNMGFVELTSNTRAWFELDGSDDDHLVRCHTASSIAAADEIVTYPPIPNNGLGTAVHRYAVVVQPDSVDYFVNGARVAHHKTHLVQPYMDLVLTCQQINNAALAGHTDMLINEIRMLNFDQMRALVMQPDPQQLWATVQDATEFVSGEPSAPTNIADNLVHEVSAAALHGLSPGKSYCVQQIGGADICVYLAAGAAPAVATVRRGFHLFNGIPWVFTAGPNEVGLRIWVAKAVDGTANADVSVLPVNGGSGV